MSKKTYLGDGLYADSNEEYIVLTAENGVSVQETVYLDPRVFAALLDFAKACGWMEETNG